MVRFKVTKLSQPSALVPNHVAVLFEVVNVVACHVYVSHAVIVYSLFKPFDASTTSKVIQYFGEEKSTIYHSPYLIRSGEKAPPIA